MHRCFLMIPRTCREASTLRDKQIHHNPSQRHDRDGNEGERGRIGGKPGIRVPIPPARAKPIKNLAGQNSLGISLRGLRNCVDRAAIRTGSIPNGTPDEGFHLDERPGWPLPYFGLLSMPNPGRPSTVMNRKNGQEPNCPDVVFGRPRAPGTQNSYDFRSKPGPSRTTKLSTPNLSRLAPRYEQIEAGQFFLFKTGPLKVP
jgi:hypothetical protein